MVIIGHMEARGRRVAVATVVVAVVIAVIGLAVLIFQDDLWETFRHETADEKLLDQASELNHGSGISVYHESSRIWFPINGYQLQRGTDLLQERSIGPGLPLHLNPFSGPTNQFLHQSSIDSLEFQDGDRER